ncbi:MAG: glutamine--fructose-6-phosphate transaminase (isomerizing) [Candidatus Bipolaricaulota bacterium]
MCGIIGLISDGGVQPTLLAGLKRLEYRGYDSAGIAVMGKGELGIRKREGKIGELGQELHREPVEGEVGIGHTRWATHGAPNSDNAHPHTSCEGKFALVHNGIIENFRSLRKELRNRGHRFSSETDTEVLVHLIEEYEGSLEERVICSLQRVEGTFAVAALSLEEPDKIVAARRRSPLVVGTEKGERVLASDIPAILNHTREVYFMEDDEIAILTPERVEFTDMERREIDKEASTIDWDPISAQKGGYKHFMLKEIHEQAQTLGDTVRGRMTTLGKLSLDEGQLSAERVENIRRIHIVACGTSSYAARVSKYIWEDFLDLPIEVELGSEFRYRNPPLDEDSLVIGISQSGETADTLAGLEKAREKGAYILSVPNVLGSTITRRSDAVFYTHAGPEIGVASTKAFTSQLAALVLLGLELGRIRGTVSGPTRDQVLDELSRGPNLLQQILDQEAEVESLAGEFYQKDHFLFLGRDVLYPIALEGALKLKEISYIHAEGYPAGELKHGPIALIDEDMPVLALVTRKSVYDKVFSNIEEVKARKGTVIVVTDAITEEIESVADRTLLLPQTERCLLPLLYVIPLQLLAYHIGVLRGTDVDQPRNLAKSVTVE